MKLQLTVFIFVFLGFTLGLTNQIQAQKSDGIIEFKDGRKQNYFIYDFKPSASKIKVKTKNGKKERIKADDIKSITYKDEEGEIVYKRFQCGSLIFNKVMKGGKMWLTEFYSEEGIKGYYCYSKMSMQGGYMSTGFYKRTNFSKASIEYYIKRDKDKYAILIATEMNQGKLINSTWDKNMRNNFSRLIKKECPQFKKLAKKKKFKIANIEEMLDAYKKTCK